jgi:hypothetical protein
LARVVAFTNVTGSDLRAKGPFYILGCGQPNHDIVTFDYARSPDYDAFLAGGRLPEGMMTYRGRGARARRALASGHLFSFPHLVSARMGALLEDFSDDVQLVDALVEVDNEVLRGFRSLRAPAINDCVDLAASEYKITNFDQRDPHYSFYYIRLLDDIEWARDVQRAVEMPDRVVVSQRFKDACFAAELGGLVFNRAVDLTPADRSLYEVVP